MKSASFWKLALTFPIVSPCFLLSSALAKAPLPDEKHQYPIQYRCWNDGMAAPERPEVTCVSLSQSLLLSLLGKTREQVVEIMGVPGDSHKASRFLSETLKSGETRGTVNVIYNGDGMSVEVMGYAGPAKSLDEESFDYR